MNRVARFARQKSGGPRALLQPDEWRIKSANQVVESSPGRCLWKCYSKGMKINFLSFPFSLAAFTSNDNDVIVTPVERAVKVDRKFWRISKASALKRWIKSLGNLWKFMNAKNIAVYGYSRRLTELRFVKYMKLGRSLTESSRCCVQ